MDHLAKQKNTLIRVFSNGFVSNFDRILNAITEAKMAGNQDTDGAEVEGSRRKIPL